MNGNGINPEDTSQLSKSKKSYVVIGGYVVGFLVNKNRD
jgi:hypothetical protein